MYRKSAGPRNSSLTFESAAFGGGRLTPSRAMLYVTDYLGSVRAVVDGQSGELYKASDYSAFGEENDVVVPQHGIIPTTQLATAILPDGTTIRDSYTGKEDQSHDFGTSYTDFGARQYNPSLRRWMIPDPLSEKYYGISPYAFCNNNPVNLVDPDGKTPRLYIQKSGLGHVFVTVGDGENTIVYTYGRYGALDGSSGITSGKYTPNGEGVLMRLRGNDAAAYLVDVLKEGDMEIYQINAASDDDVSSFYDALFFQGVSPSNTEKETFNNPNARVIDKYSLLTNNCVTTSVKGINSRSKIIKTNSISPDGLSDDLNESLGSSPKIVKIENPISFVFDLIKKLCHE